MPRKRRIYRVHHVFETREEKITDLTLARQTKIVIVFFLGSHEPFFIGCPEIWMGISPIIKVVPNFDSQLFCFPIFLFF